MKHLVLTFSMLLMPLMGLAQQVQIEKRSQTALLYPTFQEAKILQTFGRSVKAKANIFLKMAHLFIWMRKPTR